jgi:GTPase
MYTPIVAIIGRPNVGKSTLFNRIIRKPLAITDGRPGVTRDRNAVDFEWNGRKFMLVDTGGYVASSTDFMEQAVSEQSRLAVEEADAILFVVDVKTGITDLDSDISHILLKSGKPVVLSVTKVDRRRDESDIYEFYNLGIGEPFPVSGLTGHGTGDLLDEITASLPSEKNENKDDSELLKIALIGRPNVGKSSIVNSLSGGNNVLVTDVPGTTRDSTDTRLTVNGREIVLVDTAGLKPVVKLKESLEYYSSLRTLRSLGRCDIAVVVIDISEGLISYDKRLINDVIDAGKGLIISANKWDLVTKDTMTMKRHETLIFDELPDKINYPIIFTSALTGKRVPKIIDVAIEIDERRKYRIQTSELNSFIENLPITPGTSNLTIFYATQYDITPPSFIFFVNDIRKVKGNFIRFLEKQLRKEFDFEGTPIRLSFKRRG